MHVCIPRRELQARLQTVAKAIPTQTALPALRGVLLDAGGALLRLAATDLELAIETRGAATVRTPGRACVSGRDLLSVVAALPEGDVEISADDRRVTLRAGAATLTLDGMHPDDYPALPELAPGYAVTLPGADLSAALGQVIYACSDDSTRPILTGVLVRLGETASLRLVATDTHRLAMRDLDLPADPGVEGVREAIVPAAAAQEIARLAGDVTLRLDRNQLLAQNAETSVTTRIIDGQFPRFERAIPAESATTATVNVGTLTAALRRARLVAQHAAAKDRVQFTLDGPSLALWAEALSRGTAAETLCDVETNGPGLAWALNVSFLLELLTHLDPAHHVTLGLTDPLRPVLITSPEVPGLTAIVMPMQVQ